MNDYLMFGYRDRDRAAVRVSPMAAAVLFVLALVFVSGLYLGVLLFGTREASPTTVVTCPAPGTQQVAVWPKDCPREAVSHD
ncbi:hypothetical protein [Nocardia seriolae]|uniref:Uncharacterized protein n=1 Tax=Nocardia seriolae TaxID=37332 RepID=A0A0B8N357_9NOCA|nr:hypothetical protein [Nocardia seriolae]APB01712.1 hypothetical protein NS506_07693 [Nocardia seriolae]MTJ60820.1 hypothetical protein [Nocardia seriolae]MTJ76113.1 hypothetical protein [Nocardia seriolae]MTJ91038.1 hypothetical protein [Nocardia seriolae]MTK35000.1 hypothetical protein [Nocardia seriolae]